jgi:anthranilate/para-aminobenzoate synthase component II
MAHQNLSFSAHGLSLDMNKFNFIPGLYKNWTVTQTDYLNDTEFVNAFEMKNYPIFGMQWHPEY